MLLPIVVGLNRAGLSDWHEAEVHEGQECVIVEHLRIAALFSTCIPSAL